MVSGKILRESFCLLSFSLISQVVLQLINELDLIRPNDFLNLKPSFYWEQECKWEGVLAQSRNQLVTSFCRGGHQDQGDCDLPAVIWLAGGRAPPRPRSPSPRWRHGPTPLSLWVPKLWGSRGEDKAHTMVVQQTEFNTNDWWQRYKKSWKACGAWRGNPETSNGEKRPLSLRPEGKEERDGVNKPGSPGGGGCRELEPRRRHGWCRQRRLKQRAPGSKRLVYPQPTLCLPLAISSRQPVSKGAWKTQCVEAAENQNKQANDLHGFPEEITSIFVSFIHHKIFTLIEIKDSQGKKNPHWRQSIITLH